METYRITALKFTFLVSNKLCGYLAVVQSLLSVPAEVENVLMPNRVGKVTNKRNLSVELIFGFALMGLGIMLFLVGRSKSKTNRVEASNGSVAVGGKNPGTITNVNIGALPEASHGSHWLTVTAIIVELVGMAVVIWHAWHLAAK